MGNLIKPKRRYVTGIPSPAQLEQGEIAINLFDKKIYSKDIDNNVVVLGVGDAVSESQLIGFIIANPSMSIPDGFLECNGASLSKTTYANLFAKIGTNYGGDSTNFKLPDLRGEFIRGWDNGRGVDSGRLIGSYQDDQFSSHNHKFADAAGGTGGPFLAASAVNFTAGLNDNTSSTGGAETRPRNIAMMHCIKY